ncbi:hypothetical protein OJF2_51210 [Aquisphaera giovannonii]|uniref:DUF1508 domain-containing protein n=1 Tax=Aquisphaera giovannonii TaxID=406548 RepID=A0A5B9W857_9BACT|nr:hypothetical protein [Aquisphaera giovannonii]QEH36537.1 hypothetical protein OJF2_51210 [Aquisphaera giovannonii]
MKIEIWQTVDLKWKIDVITGNRKVLFRSAIAYANRRNALAAAKLLKGQLGKAKIVEVK